VLSACVAVVCIGLLPFAQASCQTPITPEEAFSCTAADASYFKAHLPDTWWTATNPPNQYVPGLSFIKNYYSCCRFCIWSFDFPPSAPVVAMHGPTLDCVSFKTDFTAFDQDKTLSLNQTEMGFYLAQPPNDYLIANKILDGASVFRQADIDGSGAISLEEFLLLRHFWAVVHTVKTGPLSAAEDGRPIASGPLGGLYLDQGMVQAFFTVANSMNIETYLVQNPPWDTSLTREPVAEELSETLLSFDIDGSTRISLEEHYFRVFADRNGDGWLSKDEYYLSLYKKTNPAGKPDNPYLFPINFILHDWDNDERITYLERKFVAADVNQDAELTREEWVKGDFPNQYGPFDGHSMSADLGKEPTINTVRFFFYTIFHECATQGLIEYRSSLVASPWSRSCILDVLIDHNPPFVNAQLNTTAECGGGVLFCNTVNGTQDAHPGTHHCTSDYDCANGRGCTYFGFCHKQEEMEPVGAIPRWRRWMNNKPPSGYTLDVMKEAMSRLKYNYTLTVKEDLRLDDALAPMPLEGTKKKQGRPPLTLVLTSAFEQLRYTAKDSNPINVTRYACTSSLWPSDGFVVVVRTTPDILSNQMGMWYMLGSASFVNFVAVFFFFVLVMGHFFWFFERTLNEDHFRGFYAEGVMDGLWFAMVTVTTVGYGDKVCLTGFGRFFGAFWMLFGLICFGLFGGQVVTQLGEMQQAANIQNVDQIFGLNVGVLAKAYPGELSSIYGFQAREYDTVKAAADAVKRKDIPAMIMPHADVLAYFEREEQYTQQCGNPLKIVGEPLLQDKLQFSIQNSLCACDRCDKPREGTSVYAAQYLTSAVNEEMQQLAQEGFLASNQERYLLPSTTDSCGPGHGFDIYSIVAMLVSASTYFFLLWFVNSKSTRPFALRLYDRLDSFLLELSFIIGIKHRSRKYLDADEEGEVDEEEDNNVLVETARSEHIEKYMDKLQELCLGHNADIRKLQVEVMEGRKTMSRIIRFFTTSGAVILCVVCNVYTTLVIVWGSEIRLSELGAPADAIFTTSLPEL